MTAFTFEQARYNMIEQQIRPWDVLDQQVLDILTHTRREAFVPQRYRNLAFSDVAIPLGHGQSMLKPNVEGRILQALALQPNDKVLEVGTGSGYLTACLAQLAANVVSVDIIPEFVDSAHAKLKAHAIRNVMLQVGDASCAWGAVRYNAIAVTGSVAKLDHKWRESLSLGGRLFIVVGESPVMEALLITRIGAREWITTSLFDTELTALRGAESAAAFVF